MPSPSESVGLLSFSDDELVSPAMDSASEEDELSESEDDDSSELVDPLSVLTPALRVLNQSAFRCGILDVSGGSRLKSTK